MLMLMLSGPFALAALGGAHMYDPSTTGSHSLTRATNVNGRAMAGTVCSWFDSGVRLTPAVAPVASWYDSGVRLKLPPVDMLEAFRSELHKAERQATEEQEEPLLMEPWP